MILVFYAPCQEFGNKRVIEIYIVNFDVVFPFFQTFLVVKCCVILIRSVYRLKGYLQGAKTFIYPEPVSFNSQNY